jgi:hypothetical protein
MAWKKGPLPKGTFNWGAVTLVSEKHIRSFHFADFFGDHVKLTDGRLIKAHEIQAYNNCIGEVPKEMRE